MGIHQLSKVLNQHAPKSIKKRIINYYTNQTVAIDASLSIYQFLIAVRSEGTSLVTSEGETTSHLVGLFYRTIRIVSSGIKPLYVFDGLPPVFKLNELAKRLEKRQAAIKEYEEAFEKNDKAAMEKYDKRKTKVTKKHVDDCKKLLTLMGIPFLVAPSEAEAYCAYLCKRKLVYGVTTEDMDALTFGAPVLLRNLNASEAKKLPINEFNLENILTELNMNMDEFIDMCILLGCDYCEGVKGIGPMKGYNLIKKYKNIDEIMKNEPKIVFPDNWNYEDARKIFHELSEMEEDQKMDKYKFGPVDIEGLNEFLVKENGFSEERVKKGMEKFNIAKGKSKQSRLDQFMKK